MINRHIDSDQWEFYIVCVTCVSFLPLLSAVLPFLNFFPLQVGIACSLLHYVIDINIGFILLDADVKVIYSTWDLTNCIIQQIFNFID